MWYVVLNFLVKSFFGKELLMSGQTRRKARIVGGYRLTKYKLYCSLLQMIWQHFAGSYLAK